MIETIDNEITYKLGQNAQENFDLIFIDAYHKYESCVKDFNKIEDLDTLREVLDISSEHSLETYPAAILYHSHEK